MSSKPKKRRVRWEMLREHMQLYHLAERLRQGWALSEEDRELAARVLQAVHDGEDILSRYYEAWSGQVIPPQQVWIALDYLTAEGKSNAKDVARRWGIAPSSVTRIAGRHKAQLQADGALDPEKLADMRRIVEIKLRQHGRRSPTP